MVIISIPIFYLLVALLLTYIPYPQTNQQEPENDTIFIQTNGVHLSIILEINQIDAQLLKDLKKNPQDRYFSFAWGDKNFYLNTPTWRDLTFKNAFIALFLKSPTLIHVSRYQNLESDWVVVPLNKKQLQKLNKYLNESFYLDSQHQKITVEQQLYSSYDNFYEANGNYSLFKTCNSWVNTAFKESDLNCSLWTPFDFGLIHRYQAN